MSPTLVVLLFFVGSCITHNSIPQDNQFPNSLSLSPDTYPTWTAGRVLTQSLNLYYKPVNAVMIGLEPSAKNIFVFIVCIRSIRPPKPVPENWNISDNRIQSKPPPVVTTGPSVIYPWVLPIRGLHINYPKLLWYNEGGETLNFSF